MSQRPEQMGRRVVLWIAMLAAVAVCAAGSYEHVVIVPEWTEAPPDSLAIFHGSYGIDTGRWWRVVHIPTLLLTIAAFLLLRGHPRRSFVAGAALGYIVVLAATGVWFLPELVALTDDLAAPIARHEWRNRAQYWEVASLVRLAMMYVNAGFLVWAAAAMPTKQSSAEVWSS
jgi:hypothetical protein